MSTIKWFVIIAGLSTLHTLFYYDKLLSPTYDFFLFTDDADMSLRGYIWRLEWKIITIILFWMVYILEKPVNQQYILYFVFLSVFILIEFLLSYNTPWIKLPFGWFSLEFGIWHIFLIFSSGIYSRLLLLEYKSQL